MSDTTSSKTPVGLKITIAVLMLKSIHPILGELIPQIAIPNPLPFLWGILAFLVPAVLLPLIIAWALVRSPAAGFWSTLTYAGFAALVNVLMILAPMIVTEPTGLPTPDPHASARAFEQTWRMVSIGISLVLALSILRPSIIRWIRKREDQLHESKFPSRRTPTIAARATWIFPLIIGSIVPTLAWFAAQRFIGHFRFGDALMDILLEHLKGRALMLDLFSMLPFAVLAGTAYKNARRMSLPTLWAVTLGGTIGIVALMLPLYYMGWETIYNDIKGDERSTGAMIFFFTPLYCLATMLGGMLLGWITARFLRKGVDDLIEDHS